METSKCEHDAADADTAWADGLCACCLQQEVERLKGEVAAARKDAARYRWLRNLPGNDEAMLALEAACRDPVTPEQFDSAIDAAMREEK